MGTPAQGIPTIYIDSVDKTGVYIPGKTQKEEGLGSTPNQFQFWMKEEPTERDEIVVDISWDGAADVRFFGGHISQVDPFAVGSDGSVWWRVLALDYRWEADWEYIKHREVEAAANTIVANVIAKQLIGFTSTDVESGGNIGPYRAERYRFSELMMRAARDAAMFWDIGYSRNVRLFGPDAHVSSIHFDRQAASPNIIEDMFNARKDVMSMANLILAEGDEGVQVVRKDTGLQPPVLSLIVPVPGTENRTTLARVADEYLAARKVTPWRGDLTTFEETLLPGDNFDVSDSFRSLSNKTVRTERLLWTEQPDRSWQVQAHWTTERTLDALEGIMGPDDDLRKDNKRHRNRGNPRVVFLPSVEPPRVNEPRVVPPSVIKSPTKKIALGAAEVAVLVRIDDDAGKFWIKLQSTVAATDVKLAISAKIKARDAITVSIVETGLEAGEGTEIIGNGTRRVEIGTTSTSDDANRWIVNNDADEMEVTVTGDQLGNAIVTIILSALDGVDEIDAVMVGENALDVDVSVGRRKSYQFPLQIQIPGAARIGSRRARRVVDEANSGNLAQSFVGERQSVAGFLDSIRKGRILGMDWYASGGVNRLLNKLGHIENALLRESGGPALNKAFAKANAGDDDDLGSVPDDSGGTWRKPASVNSSNLVIVSSLSTLGQVLSSTVGSGGFINVDVDEFENTHDLDTDVRMEVWSHSNSRISYKNIDPSTQGYSISRAWVKTT